MEDEREYFQKKLQLTYQEYEKRGLSLQNLRIQDYIVFQKIGQGRLGPIYRGMSDITKNAVAVKVIHLYKIDSEDKAKIRSIDQRMAKFQPIIMSKCQSDFVIKLYDVYCNKDLKLMITQYCNGTTLQREIEEKKRLPQQEAVAIIKHIIHGLQQLHKNKIIHQDLTAKNIISHNGIYKIIDFGMSKKVMISKESAKELRIQTSMAPQIYQKKQFSRKADIWCIGILFFQMIYGQCPYDSFTCQDFYASIRDKKFFQSKQPLTLNGFEPSQQAYNFLKFLLIYQSKERPNWNDLCEYSLIENEKHQQLNQRLIHQVSVIFEPQSQQIEETMVIELNQENSGIFASPLMQQNEKDLKNIERFSKTKTQIINDKQYLYGNLFNEEIPYLYKQNDKINRLTYELDNKQIQTKKLQIDEKQNKHYQFAQKAHLQCLKTQFIFRQIFNPLYITQYIDHQSRNAIQFMYLLIVRCLNNLSIINYQLQNQQKDNNCLFNLNIQIPHLYQPTLQKFQQYSKKLTACENKWMSIIGDFVKKRISSQEIKIKDNFLSGIQTIDYSKVQQIKFIFEYYKEFIRPKISQINNIKNVVKRLDLFVQINMICRQDLKNYNKTFQQLVKQILVK